MDGVYGLTLSTVGSTIQRCVGEQYMQRITRECAMVYEYGVSERDVYMHTWINSEFKINIYEMVRIDRIPYTVGAEIPKKYLIVS